MTGSPILVHQTLHGYDDGHRLLKASLDLSNDAKREMLVLSDLAGQRRPKGFESYITGYGLFESNLYALARTWLAPEMKRPGCVWTHTLLLDSADLSRLESIQDIEHITALWTRPNEQTSRPFYGKALNFSFNSAPSEHLSGDVQGTRLKVPENAFLILNGLYGQPNSPVFVAANDSQELKDFVYSIWIQQWPRLRRAFSFCTGVTSCRRLRGEPLDLQIAPYSAFHSLVREVPDGFFVNDIETVSDKKKPSAIKEGQDEVSFCVGRAIDDLRKPSVRLREFLRLFGAEAKKPRAGFAALIDIFDNIDAINSERKFYDHQGKHVYEEDQLQTLIETIANDFPSSKEGVRLKLATFGTSAPNQVLNISEVEMLEALASTPHHKAFDRTSLDMRQRATRMWGNDPDQTEQVLLNLTQGGANPFVEDVLAGVADAVNAQDALSLFRRNPSLASSFIRRNPALTTSPLLWQGPTNLQHELFDALERHSLTEEERRVVAAAVFAADAQDLATEVVERLGETGAQGILRQLIVSPRELTAPWRQALATKPEVLSHWLETNIISGQRPQGSVEVALQIIGLLHPRSPHVRNIAPSFWPLFSDLVAPQLLGSTAQAKILRLNSKATFFLVAIALDNPDSHGDKLIERFFEVVHDDLATNNFDYSAWKWVEEVVPPLPYNDWDKCERLRRAVIERFLRFGWPLRNLIGAIQRQPTLEFILRSCSETEEGRRVLKAFKRALENKELNVPKWQSDVLLRRRKKSWFPF